MEAARAACGIAAPVLAFAAAVLGSASLANIVRQWMNAGRMLPSTEGQEQISKRLLRRGIPVLAPVARGLLRIPRLASLMGQVEQMALRRFATTTIQSVTTLVCAGCIICLVVGSLISRSIVFGVAAAISCVAVLWAVSEHDADVYKEAARQGVPDVLHAMSVCFGVGYSLQQTFQQLSIEAPDALKYLFVAAADDLETGSTVEEALDRFRTQALVPELSFVAVALDIQHKAGGAIQQVLDSARDSLESELALRRSLRVHTAQAKLSARVVVLVSFGMVAVLSLVSKDFLLPFFQSPLGIALLVIALIMQAAGILCVRRLLRVEVD